MFPITALAITSVFDLLLFSFSTLMRHFEALLALVQNKVFSINCEIDNIWTSMNSNPSIIPIILFRQTLSRNDATKQTMQEIKRLPAQKEALVSLYDTTSSENLSIIL